MGAGAPRGPTHRCRESALCGAVVAVYDVSRRETFDNLSQWLDEIEKFCPGGGKGTVKLLVGNKIDLVGGATRVWQVFVAGPRLLARPTCASGQGEARTAGVVVLRPLDAVHLPSPSPPPPPPQHAP